MNSTVKNIKGIKFVFLEETSPYQTGLACGELLKKEIYLPTGGKPPVTLFGKWQEFSLQSIFS